MYKELSYTNLVLNVSLVVDCRNVVFVVGAPELQNWTHLAIWHLVIWW